MAVLSKDDMSNIKTLNFDAVIVGGGNKDNKFGVRLDMPSRVANSAKYIKLV